MDRITKSLQRRQELTTWARTQPVQGHYISVEKDYGKSFRSRPGSADYKASCSCGWQASQWSYGEGDGFATAAHHLKQADGGAEREDGIIMKLEKPYSAILAATREYVATEVSTTNMYALWAVSEALGGDGNHPGETFYGQVKRALAALVDDGTLVKVARGELRPSAEGWWTASEPYYYRAEDFERLCGEADAAKAAYAAAKEQQTALVAQGQAAGLNVHAGDSVLSVVVDVDSFKQLLTQKGPA